MCSQPLTYKGYVSGLHFCIFQRCGGHLWHVVRNYRTLLYHQEDCRMREWNKGWQVYLSWGVLWQLVRCGKVPIGVPQLSGTIRMVRMVENDEKGQSGSKWAQITRRQWWQVRNEWNEQWEREKNYEWAKCYFPNTKTCNFIILWTLSN